MAGLVHFTTFFRLMEEAESAFWRSCGVSLFVRDASEPFGWPKVRVACEYLAPARFEDIVETRLTVEMVGTRSVQYAFAFRLCARESGLPGEEIARGKATVACVAFRPGEGERLEPIEIPDSIRRHLE